MALNFFLLLNILIVSLALNVGLIVKFVFVEERLKTEQSIPMADAQEKHAHITPRTHMATPPPPPPSSTAPAEPEDDGQIVVNVDHGDPTMYERFWLQMGDKTTVVIPGWQSLSYFSDARNLCWFLEPEFAEAVIRLHKLVGNAITDGRHIVVGTGSTQLIQAALYALSPDNASEPMSVVSAAPFFSSYPLIVDFLKSGLYKWEGDARDFTKEGPYIELITSPNNPDGYAREAVVRRNEGILIHDLAYYWPQYTPISSAADHELMLFTVSKSTGHAGSRIGWTLVKDREVARKMIKYIELSTIGVSKDSQIRGAKILQVVMDSYTQVGNSEKGEDFFEYGYNLMEKRWKQLRAVVKQSRLFSLPEFPLGYCNFSSRTFAPNPAFAWLKCEGEEIEDCEGFLRSHKILTRGGEHFGGSSKYVRVSMLDRERTFNLLIQRLSKIHP
ncbi:hypothetical protein F0562_024297 [Nyssa sinensis]|uniref:Alliinase C-terminal domain-containing protein n=1 Tax=Nyssa sinensis TaxID=561372 RepID=A0A5J5BDP7_9ASTE|nr:hypothetical protein F0562_024297 [Nyssa sinensis]